MFLLCQNSSSKYYDFFPYKYGACSFVLHQDKLRLAALDYLTEAEGFQISGRQEFFSQIEESTQQEISSLLSKIGSLRGDKLLRKVYIEYPYYASRSVVAEEILTPKEYKLIAASRNSEESACLFTIGYEGLTIDEYLSVLIANNIKVLADIRKNPIS